MEELLSQIVSYLRGMWRYRWWALALAWIVGIAGGVVVYMMPDQYRSSARVFVDTQSVLRPLMSGLAVQPNVEQQVAILTRTLISRPNMDKLITMADLDLTIRTPAEREALVNKLMSDLRIGQGGGRGRSDNMFTLSYQDTDPQRAHAVVQALLSLFVESGLVGKRADSDSARRFIEEQIAAYETRLTDAENRLKEFRLRNMALLGDGSTNYLSQISSVTQQLNQARLELREAETSAAAFRDQLANESPTSTASTPSFEFSPTAELDARIDGLERDLDAMLLRYTEQHPDVIATRSLMARLDEQRQAALELLQEESGESATTPNTNPVYQQIKFSLSNAEARVAGLTARVAEFEERLQFLRERAELLPKLEAEEAQLNRDYGIHRRNYEQLVQRRESATMSVEMAAQSGIADFRVIEPPSRPTSPSAPNRLMLMPLVGVAALGVGLALAFLLSQIRPAFNSGRMLREVSGLPVLGTVSRVTGPAYRHARRLSMLAFGGGLISYGLAIAAAMAAMQILQR